MTSLKPKFVIVTALVVVLLFFDVCTGLVTAWSADDHVVTAMTIGLLSGQYIGQLNLISVWAAVSSGNVILRLPWSLLLTTLMLAALILGRYLVGEWNHQGAPGVTIAYGGLLAFGCIVTQVPLWVASRVFRWRLVTLQDGHQMSAQFNLRQMFVGTVLLAGTLAIGRWLLSDAQWSDMNELRVLWEFWAFLIPLAVCNLVFVVPSIWAAFLLPKNAGFLLAAAALLAAVGPIELLVICFLFGDSPSKDDFPEWLSLFSMLHLGQVFVVYTSLVLLRRFANFRLVRNGLL